MAHSAHPALNASEPGLALRFVPRGRDRRCLTFPCNAAGHVEMDRLSERERIDYLFARALRGRDYSLDMVDALHDEA